MKKKGQTFLDFSRIFWSFLVGFIIGIVLTILIYNGVINLPFSLPFLGNPSP